ncbi:MAG TPA: APC family permease, partial [Rugosimonospora sp.]|nr:APC family permease [Rugosimonospora sp.]
MDTARQLPGNALTTRRVVFLLIGAAAPLAGVVGNMPLALVYGNGVGLPAMFLVSTIVLLCFAVGYAAMNRRVVSTGAFYTYVECGLGRVPAAGVAYLAVLSYTVLTLGYAGAFGYFVHVVMHTVGTEVPWEVPSAFALFVVGILGYRSVTLSARIITVLMVIEFSALFLLNGGIVLHRGAAALPLASLSPHEVMAGSVGVGLVFALTSFVGFESGALYGEETVDPRRSVSRATYIAVAVLGVFFLLTSWLIVGALGVANARQQASTQLGMLLFQVAQDNAGPMLSDAIGVLMCTGLLASMLAIHSAASRYMFALGRDRVLPAALGRYHTRHLSPHIASMTVTLISTVVVSAFAVAGLDPYLTLATSMIGLATLGVVLLQAFAALAIVVFFVRRREGDYLRTVAAPAVGGLGLVIAFVLTAVHFRTLVGTDNLIVGNLPWLLGAVVVVGAFAGMVMRGRIRGAGGPAEP